MVAAGQVTADDIATFNKNTAAAWRDQVWTDAAVHILERHKPNLLLYHLLALDSTHHTYGPGTLASTTAMAFLDAQVARLMAALERSGLAESTTVVVLADHGFRTARRTVNLNVALRNAGLIRGEGAARQTDAWTMPWGGAAGIYLTDRSARAGLLPKIEAAVAGLEGVDRVVTGADLLALGLPDPATSDQAPDIVVAVRDGYDVGRADTGALVVDTDADACRTPRRAQHRSLHARAVPGVGPRHQAGRAPWRRPRHRRRADDRRVARRGACRAPTARRSPVRSPATESTLTPVPLRLEAGLPASRRPHSRCASAILTALNDAPAAGR